MTRIPLPGSNPAEPFQRGVEQGTNLWQQLLGQGVNLGRMHQQGQQFEKTLGFNEKQLAQQHAHHQDTFGIQKAQLAMQKQLIPHQINALVDAHKLAPWQARKLEAQAYQAIATAEKQLAFSALFSDAEYEPGTLMNRMMGANTVSMGGGQGAIPQSGMVMPGMGGQLPQQPINQNVQNGPMGGPIAQPPIPTGPEGAQNQRLNIDIPYAAQQQQQTQAPEQEAVVNEHINPRELEIGQEVVLKPGDQKKLKRDNFAGSFGIPDIKVREKDGVEYTTWPSGRKTAVKVSESPQEKAELETQKKEQQETNKLREKEIQTIKEELPKAKSDYALIEELEKLYVKNEGHKDEWWGQVVPGKFGEIQAGLRKMSINNEDYGRMQDILGKLVGKQSNEYSSRGLQAGLKLAQENKPGFEENYKNSKGKLLQLKENAKKAIDVAEATLKERQAEKSSIKRPELLETKEHKGKTYYRYADGWHKEKL